MASPFDSEENWYARTAAPNLPQDQVAGMITQGGQQYIDQSREAANQNADSIRAVGGINAGILPNAVNSGLGAYYKGAEESRKGTAFDTQQQEAKQRMQLAQSEEGRASGRYATEQEMNPLKKQGLQQDVDYGGMRNKKFGAEESAEAQIDPKTGLTLRQTNAMNTAKAGGLNNQLTQAQIAAAGANSAMIAQNATEARFEKDADSVAYTPDPQKALTELLGSNAYASIPLERRQLIAQASLTRNAAARTNAGSNADMTWEITGPGQDFHEAQRQLARTEKLAQSLEEKANLHEKYSYLGGNVQFDDALKARREAAQTLRQMGDETAAGEIEGVNLPTTSIKSTINNVTARKLESSANALEAEISLLNPRDQQRPNVQQALGRVKAIRAKAEQLKTDGGIQEKPTLLPPSYASPTDVRGTTGATGGTGATRAGLGGPSQGKTTPVGATAPQGGDPLGFFSGGR